jgi:transcriptional regulator with XRE-family HTH domain
MEIRELRLGRGLSLSRAAKLFGFSASYLSQVEHGHKLPPLPTLQRMEVILHQRPGLLQEMAVKAREVIPLPADVNQIIAGNRAKVFAIIRRAEKANAWNWLDDLLADPDLDLQPRPQPKKGRKEAAKNVVTPITGLTPQNAREWRSSS